jgi:polar amino acid transport system substrate-binding protein
VSTPRFNAPKSRRLGGRIIAFSCAAALLVAACGSSSKSSTPTTTAPSSPSTAAGATTASSSVDTAAAALVPAAIRTAGVIRDGVNLPNPPMEYQVNGSGALTGFDIQLAQALAAKLGLKVTFDNLAFTALLTSLDSGRVDIVFSSLFDTAARQAKYNILDDLNTGAQIFTTPANAAKAPSVASLCGQTVETAVGTAFTGELTALSASTCAGKAPLKVLAVGGSFADEVLQITTGRAVAAIATPDNIAYELTTSPGTYVKVGQPFDLVPYGIDIPKADTGLLSAMKMAMQDLLADGAYAKIAAANDLQQSELSSITVNSGK